MQRSSDSLQRQTGGIRVVEPCEYVEQAGLSRAHEGTYAVKRSEVAWETTRTPLFLSPRSRHANCQIAADRRWLLTGRGVHMFDGTTVTMPDRPNRRHSDSHILDHAGRWFDLARLAIDQRIRDAWIIDPSDE